MADPKPSTPGGATSSSSYKSAAPNPIWRMLGIPNLPRRLPSRNWLIFLTATTIFSGAIIYDRREKRRATLRWARAVSHLALEPNPSCRHIPRKLTVVLEAPPGDGFRAAREHFDEYVKPVLAASGLDWDFVKGNRQGDVRGAVAERIRRQRRENGEGEKLQDLTDEELVHALREKTGVAANQGVKGDIVIGRHAWKEYVRGLHEGWLGPLELPLRELTQADGDDDNDGKKEKKEEEGNKPARPLPPAPHNAPQDYPDAELPTSIPNELSPFVAVPLPHVLGISATFTRLHRFLTRRNLADEIGRDVAAACLATLREASQDEVESALAHEEKEWAKSVWKADDATKDDGAELVAKKPARETVWRDRLAVDPRIVSRMKAFELAPQDEAKARGIVIREEEIEGWIRGALRSAWRWGVAKWNGQGKWRPPALGNIDSDD